MATQLRKRSCNFGRKAIRLGNKEATHTPEVDGWKKLLKIKA
jgi:hypothetical protein